VLRDASAVVCVRARRCAGVGRGSPVVDPTVSLARSTDVRRVGAAAGELEGTRGASRLATTIMRGGKEETRNKSHMSADTYQ
jgi:hypothetical protein